MAQHRSKSFNRENDDEALVSIVFAARIEELLDHQKFTKHKRPVDA